MTAVMFPCVLVRSIVPLELRASSDEPVAPFTVITASDVLLTATPARPVA